MSGRRVGDPWHRSDRTVLVALREPARAAAVADRLSGRRIVPTTGVSCSASSWWELKVHGGRRLGKSHGCNHFRSDPRSDGATDSCRTSSRASPPRRYGGSELTLLAKRSQGFKRLDLATGGAVDGALRLDVDDAVFPRAPESASSHGEMLRRSSCRSHRSTTIRLRTSWS